MVSRLVMRVFAGLRLIIGQRTVNRLNHRGVLATPAPSGARRIVTSMDTPSSSGFHSSYRTLAGEQIDLADLSEVELRFFAELLSDAGGPDTLCWGPSPALPYL